MPAPCRRYAVRHGCMMMCCRCLSAAGILRCRFRHCCHGHAATTRYAPLRERCAAAARRRRCRCCHDFRHRCCLWLRHAGPRHTSTIRYGVFIALPRLMLMMFFVICCAMMMLLLMMPCLLPCCARCHAIAAALLMIQRDALPGAARGCACRGACQRRAILFEDAVIEIRDDKSVIDAVTAILLRHITMICCCYFRFDIVCARHMLFDAVVC